MLVGLDQSYSWTPRPREISRFTRFIILHGATVKVKVSDTKYRRSPLIQGGLEIPIEVEVQMENSSENQQALSKYKTLIAENYHEPVGGKYVDATPDILKALYSEYELTDFEDIKPGEGGGGTPQHFGWGYFRPKYMIFHTPFQT